MGDMKIRIKNDSGIAMNTLITDESGAELGMNFRSVQIDVDDHNVRATLEAVHIPVDLVAHVDKIIPNEDFYELLINKRTHEVRFVDETEESVKVRVIKK